MNELLVHNGRQTCLWITPLKNEYGKNELVDVETAVIAARALRHSVPSKDHLRAVDEATWLWSASSAGLLSRRSDGVGRHDQRGINYAQLNATKICLAGHAGEAPSKALYALEASASDSKELRGGLIRVALNDDGSLPGKPQWQAKVSGNHKYDAMIVAGERIFVTRFLPSNEESHLDVYSTTNGKLLAQLPLPARAIRDGLAAAYGRLYVCCDDGSVYCLAK